MVASGCSDYWEAWPAGTAYEIKNIRANTGYRYDGVYSGSLSGMIETERIDVVLAFSTATYIIKYDANCGTGAPVNQTKTHSEVITLSTTIPTREGYYFLGWAENADATEATYQPGGIFDQDTDVTLYAVWKLREPDLILPAFLTNIGEEAFAGGAFTYAHIPDGTTRIERRAFADCPNLKDVDIPASATSIDPTAFADTSGLTIHGTDGSFAEFYANKYGFGFVAIQ